jgi:hypothetical protein
MKKKKAAQKAKAHQKKCKSKNSKRNETKQNANLQLTTRVISHSDKKSTLIRPVNNFYLNTISTPIY